MTHFDHTVITLATLAGCGQPESPTSPGAVFLNNVVSYVEDAIDNDETDTDALTQIANDAPSGVIATRWAQFIDLKGWQIDSTDLTGDKISARRLSEHAESVLFIIAETLVAALIAEHNAKDTDAE